MNPLIELKKTNPLLFTSVVLACFVLPTLRAVTPAPDGGYPGFNTAEGDHALESLTTGPFNTAVGFGALGSDTTGLGNTAVGAKALIVNTTGQGNTALGAGALFFNDAVPGQEDSGSGNTAVGLLTLAFNTNGYGNTAVGTVALLRNTGGAGNTAVGARTLPVLSGDSNLNTAVGTDALQDTTQADDNTALGARALLSNTTGFSNTAVGKGALPFSTTGSNNIAVGSAAGGFVTTGDYNIHIGSQGVDGDSNTIRIGATFSPAPSPTPSTGQNRTFIAGIRDTTTGNGDAIAVVIDSAGQLGTMSSSARFKKDIKPMDKTSEAILSLKPVNFHYKSDSKGTPQFGLIAEEVAQVNPDLVVRDRNGEIYSVRYEAVNAMLLNEFLKEHRKVEQLEKQVEALADGLQKVSAQLELSKAAPQTVLNNNQ